MPDGESPQSAPVYRPPAIPVARRGSTVNRQMDSETWMLSQLEHIDEQIEKLRRRIRLVADEAVMTYLTS